MKNCGMCAENAHGMPRDGGSRVSANDSNSLCCVQSVCCDAEKTRRMDRLIRIIVMAGIKRKTRRRFAACAHAACRSIPCRIRSVCGICCPVASQRRNCYSRLSTIISYQTAERCFLRCCRH